MKPEIKNIFFEGIDCYVASVVSVVSWLGRDYELAFSESWGFHFNDNINDILGKRINADEKPFESMLEKYHGVKLVRMVEKDKNNLLGSIISDLNDGAPAIIHFDSFWCPWSDGYQKTHNIHVLILEQFNYNSSGFTCNDPWYKKSNAFISYDSIEKSIRGRTLIELNELENNAFNWEHIISDAIEKLKNKSGASNSFGKIRLFGDRVKNELNLDLEFKGYEKEFYLSPIFANIGAIASGRYKFAKTLSYLSEKHNIKELSRLSNELVLCGSKWNVLKNLISKSYYAGTNKISAERFSRVIYNIADMEENLAESLYELANGNIIRCRNDGRTLENNNETRISKDYSRQDFVFCNLDDDFNNTAFGNNISNECPADLSGFGDYFLSDSAPSNEIINVNYMKFRFPNVKNCAFDNFTCKEQEINVCPDSYSGIMILGTAEWGNYAESIKLHFEDNEKVNIQINFTDCYKAQPLYDELIAWSGEVYSKGSGSILDHKCNIYSIYRPIESSNILKSISLPYCPNIHIFAITLVRSNR